MDDEGNEVQVWRWVGKHRRVDRGDLRTGGSGRNRNGRRKGLGTPGGQVRRNAEGVEMWLKTRTQKRLSSYDSVC